MTQVASNLPSELTPAMAASGQEEPFQARTLSARVIRRCLDIRFAVEVRGELGQSRTRNGVTHVVYLPDSETNWLYLLMKAEPSLRFVGVSREGHACSIAAGWSAGGAKPLILIQNTGMMESGDSLRGWLLGLNIPVVLMVGYRGWTRHGVNQDSAATLHRAVSHGATIICGTTV